MNIKTNKQNTVKGGVINKTRSSLGNQINSTENLQTSIGNNKTASKSEDKITFIIKLFLWAVILILPLFFTPNTPSSLELGKQVLLVGLVGMAFLFWVGKMAIKSQIRFRANFIFIPIFVFLVIMGVSSFFADYTSQSVWGFFGGEARSFISLVFLIAFFVLFVNTIKTRRDILITIYIILFSGFVATIFAFLQLWGKYILPIEGTHNLYFNTVGSVYLFGVYAGALFMLALSMFLYSKKKILKSIFVILILFFFAILVIVGLKIIWIAMIVSLALVLGKLTIGNRDTSASINSVLPMIFLILALLMVLQKQPIIKKQLPVEVLLTHKVSANIAWKAVKKDFLLGSGPANYINVYREFRPTNLGNFWSTNFNTASSYFLTLVSTVGVLGTLSFLALIVMTLIYIFKGVFVRDEQIAILGIGVGSTWVLLTFALLFYVTNITVLFVWWLALALLVSILAFSPKTELREFSTGSNSDKPSLLFSFVFVLVIISVVVALYMQGQKYVAAIHFNKALIADSKNKNIDEVIKEINKAILLDGNKDLYYRNSSLAFFAVANKKIVEKGKDLSADDAAFVSKAIKKSLENSVRAKEINPNDVDNFISLSRIYEILLPTMEGAGEKALEFAGKAIKLDPNNPNVYQYLANVYVEMADLETIKNPSDKKGELPEKAKEYLVLARENINKAIELKSDLLPARLLLVGIFEREGSSEEAINTMLESRKVFPRRPDLAFQLGLLYYRNGKLDESGGQFVQAVQLDNNYANAYYFLGLVLDKKGKKDLAIKAFEKVLELNKGNKLVEAILKNLKSGKEALDGLQQKNNINNTKSQQEEPVQPTINPDIDTTQEIPEEVTRNIDETSNTNAEENQSTDHSTTNNTTDNTNSADQNTTDNTNSTDQNAANNTSSEGGERETNNN